VTYKKPGDKYVPWIEIRGEAEITSSALPYCRAIEGGKMDWTTKSTENTDWNKETGIVINTSEDKYSTLY